MIPVVSDTGLYPSVIEGQQRPVALVSITALWKWQHIVEPQPEDKAHFSSRALSFQNVLVHQLYSLKWHSLKKDSILIFDSWRDKEKKNINKT